MAALTGSLFICAAGLVLSVLIIDLLWDAKTVVENPITESHSNAIREY